MRKAHRFYSGGHRPACTWRNLKGLRLFVGVPRIQTARRLLCRFILFEGENVVRSPRRRGRSLSSEKIRFEMACIRSRAATERERAATRQDEAPNLSEQHMAFLVEQHASTSDSTWVVNCRSRIVDVRCSDKCASDLGRGPWRGMARRPRPEGYPVAAT